MRCRRPKLSAGAQRLTCFPHPPAKPACRWRAAESSPSTAPAPILLPTASSASEKFTNHAHTAALRLTYFHNSKRTTAPPRPQAEREPPPPNNHFGNVFGSQCLRLLDPLLLLTPLFIPLPNSALQQWCPLSRFLWPALDGRIRAGEDCGRRQLHLSCSPLFSPKNFGGPGGPAAPAFAFARAATPAQRAQEAANAWAMIGFFLLMFFIFFW